jgi:hypothetical protein
MFERFFLQHDFVDAKTGRSGNSRALSAGPVLLYAADTAADD